MTYPTPLATTLDVFALFTKWRKTNATDDLCAALQYFAWDIMNNVDLAIDNAKPTAFIDADSLITEVRATVQDYLTNQYL